MFIVALFIAITAEKVMLSRRSSRKPKTIHVNPRDFPEPPAMPPGLGYSFKQWFRAWIMICEVIRRRCQRDVANYQWQHPEDELGPPAPILTALVLNHIISEGLAVKLIIGCLEVSKEKGCASTDRVSLRMPRDSVLFPHRSMDTSPAKKTELASLGKSLLRVIFNRDPRPVSTIPSPEVPTAPPAAAVRIATLSPEVPDNSADDALSDLSL